MLILLFLLLSLSVRIDATGEPGDLYNIVPHTLPYQTEDEIAISQVRESLDRMLSALEHDRLNTPADVILSDLYSPETVALLDMYSNARNDGRGDEIARLVLQAYNRFNRELQARGVQMPPLNELDNPSTIDVPLFRNVGLRRSGAPFTALDEIIANIFRHDISEQERASSVPSRFTFAASPVSRRARTDSPYSLPAIEANREFRELGLPSSVLPVNRRSLPLDSPLVHEVSPISSPQGLSAALPQTGRVHPRDETVAEQQQQQGRNVRPRGSNTSVVRQLFRRDDENGPNGGGVAAN